MIEIQKWLLHLCIACILVSVLSGFIKNEKVNTSIKSVLALYILLITLNSILGTNIKIDDFKVDNNVDIVSTVNPNSLVIQNAQQSICSQINQKFAELEIETKCKSITLNSENAQVEVVMLTDNNTKAIQTIEELLGDKITVVTENEG